VSYPATDPAACPAPAGQAKPPHPAKRRDLLMNTAPDAAPLPRITVNLSAVRSHYTRATRCHTPAGRPVAVPPGVRDIPLLIAEIERLWELACDLHQRYADLRAAALATIAATETGEPDPLFYLRDELQARRPLRPSPRGRR
jgi:hypothetical protein